MFVLSAIGFFLQLFLMYTLGWFLFCALLAFATARNGLSMAASTILGAFTAIFHLLVCAVYKGVCG